MKAESSLPPASSGSTLDLGPSGRLIEKLLQSHLQHSDSLRVYMTLLMDYGRMRSVEDLLKCVPVNMFDEFKEFVADGAAMALDGRDPNERMFTIGGEVDYTPADALRIHTWLQEHPNPELGPHDGWDYSLDRSIIQKRWEKFPHLKPPGRSD